MAEKNPRRAIINIHNHDGGGIGPHKDIRMFVVDGAGNPSDVHHFVGGVALPEGGKLARWSTLAEPHLDPERMEYNGRLSGGRVEHEATHEGALVDDDSAQGVVHFSVGDRKYAISVDPEGHAYVQGAEKTAGIFDDPVARLLILDRARAMGVIPPDLFNPANQYEAMHPAPNPALSEYMNGGGGSGIGSALGTGAKTLSLGFLGGLGAGAGWGLGQRLTARKEKKAEDPANSPATPLDAPGGRLPEDPNRSEPADPAARRTAAMTAGGFGHLPNDPI